MSKIFSINITENQYALVSRIAKKQHRSLSSIIRQLLDAYIEDYIDAEQAKKVMKDIKEGKTELVDFEDVI